MAKPKDIKIEAIDGTKMAVLLMIDREGHATVRGTVPKSEMLRLLKLFVEVAERSIGDDD